MKPLNKTLIRKTPYPTGPRFVTVKGERVWIKGSTGGVRFRGCSMWSWGCNCQVCRNAQRKNREAEALEAMAQNVMRDRHEVIRRPQLPILYHLRSGLCTADAAR